VPTVVPLGPDHLDAAVALQRACFPEPFPAELLWRREHLESHLSLFAEGQFAALAEDGSLIGTASSLVISEETWQAHRPWAKTTGGFAFTGHDPDGSTLYGADISVHPDHRGRGVARSLYAARFDLVRRRGLVRFGTTCRIPDWRAWSLTNRESDKEAYCRAVVSGEARDRTLTPLLRLGLVWVGIAEGHMEDFESGDAAAVLEWKP
jgi:GNAT superfamily N-acetyltransferase